MKLTVVYIQNDLTLGYTSQALNLYNSHSFSNVELTHCFFFFENTKYFNTHTKEEREESFKKTNNDIYPKGPNS